MNYLKLTRDLLNVGDINDLVADESCGAISIFVGTTRDNFEDKKVLSLEYEAYEPMAIKTMTKICDEMRSLWPDIKSIAIHHRVGLVPVKEASVVIAISSPHRQSSLQAVQHAIDELKKLVPIWKKEQYEDSASQWKENKECSDIKRVKKSKLDFDACTIESSAIPKNLVQIAAEETEIMRRISSFVDKKRQEIDLNNIFDFTTKSNNDDHSEDSCARLNSAFTKQKDSKGHLKVHRVKNEIGPQIKSDYLNALDKLMEKKSSNYVRIKKESDEAGDYDSLPIGIKERLENSEQFLNIKTKDTVNIYKRLKAIEDKILYLETVSPEYSHFLSEKRHKLQRKAPKKVYTVQDLDEYINFVKEKVNSDT